MMKGEERITYSWQNLNVYTNVTTKVGFHAKLKLFVSNREQIQTRKHILKNVSGVCRPGELLAILGASGAGKTTLLNALTFHNNEKVHIKGNLSINGEPVEPECLLNRAAYVQQRDLFIGSLTVREQLIFHATLRMDRSISYMERMKKVDDVITDLGLVNCAETKIGIPGRMKSISGGEMKRLSFACEVLTNPSLLLCDEPTSGLDSFMAQNVVAVMKNMAEKGKTILSTIHQPSSEVYAMFDRVLLMAEGRVAFLGDADAALNFFSKTLTTDSYSVWAADSETMLRFAPSHQVFVLSDGLGFVKCVLQMHIPHNYNPADFYISMLAVQPEQEEVDKIKIQKICDHFEQSQYCTELIKDIKDNELSTHMVVTSIGQNIKEKATSSGIYRASFWNQFQVVLWRSWLEVIREPTLIAARIVQVIMVSLLLGLIFHGQIYTMEGVRNINGALFLLITNMTFQNVYGAIHTFCDQIQIFLREHFNGMYRTDVYFLSKTLAELPIFILCPVLFVSILYFMIGFKNDLLSFIVCVMIVVLVANVAISFGYAVSCISKDMDMALTISMPLVIPFMIFGGFLLNPRSIPFYFGWLRYFSWFSYGNEALNINQWKNVTEIICRKNEHCFLNGKNVLNYYNYDKGSILIDMSCLFFLFIFYRIVALVALVAKTYRKK